MFIKKILCPLFSQASNLATFYKKISPEAEKHAILAKKIRSTLTLQQALSAVQQNHADIQLRGKTLFFQFFSDYSFGQTNIVTSKSRQFQLLVKLHNLINKLQNLSFYEQILKLSLLQKLFQYFMLVQQKKPEYQQDFSQSTTKIVSYLNRMQPDLYHGINILLIYKIQRHQELVSRALTIVNDQISNYDKKQNMFRMWSHIIFQISNLQWSELRKYHNIIKFFTFDYHLNVNKINFQLQQPGEKQIIINNLIELCKLQFHKVGLQSIPVFIKQAIQALQSQIEKLPKQVICKLLHSLSSLPLTFHQKFRNELKKKLTKGQSQQIKQNFPFIAFSTIELNKYFSKRQKCYFLFYQIIYQTTYKQQSYFYRGQITKYFQEFVKDKLKFLQQRNQDFKSIKNASRYCHLAHIFYIFNKNIALENTKKIINKFLKSIGLQKIMKQFSFTHYITLLTIYQKDTIMFTQIKEIVETQITKLKSPTRYEKFKKNALEAIENHINNYSAVAIQMVVFFMKQLVSLSNQFDFVVDRRIFFAIINKKQVKQYLIIKKMIQDKITKNDIECLLDYFILYFRKTFLGTQLLLKIIISFKLGIISMIKFLAQIKSPHLENKKGKLETNLSNYLKDNTQTIKQPLLIFDSINRVIPLIASYDEKFPFIKNLYVSTLEALENYLIHLGNQDLAFPIRVIIQFVFKFQDVISYKQLMEVSSKAILNKVYNILKMLVKDERIYVKTILLQFYYFFKQFIEMKQQQIQLKFSIKQVLKTTQNPSQIHEIYFILLELHCFKFIQLQKQQQTQYMTILSQTIKTGQLSLRQSKKFAKSTLYHILSLRLNTNEYQLFKKIISPLFVESLHSIYFENTYAMMKPFVQYFKKMNQLQQIQQFCIQSIKNSINPMTIQFFISRFSYKKINTKFLQIILNKLTSIEDQLSLSTYSIIILYHIQLIFFQNPMKYNKDIQILWNHANTNMKKQIQSVQGRENEISKNYKLGRYPVYMFSCIKNSYVQGNSMFLSLANFIKRNPQKFINRIFEKQFDKSINLNIIKFIMADQIIKQDQNVINLFENHLVEVGNINVLSSTLKQLLIQENIEHKFKWKIGKIVVPCFLPKEKEVILITKYEKQNDLETDVMLTGVHKFQYEVAKKLLPQYKIKIYNHSNKMFLEA